MSVSVSVNVSFNAIVSSRSCRVLCLCLLNLASSCRACSEPSRATVDAASPSSSSRLEAEVESIRLRAHVPAIVWATVTLHHTRIAATGFADLEAREHATPVTPFQAASIAKTIIATCVMQLVEKGQLALDADVSSYVGFTVRPTGATTPITLRHLLTHTSSIIDTPASESSAASGLGDFLSSYFAADAGAPQRAPFIDAGPGKVMLYSNVGPSLAALAVEKVSRSASFAEYASTHVFTPLGMKATWFRSSATATPGGISHPDAAVGYASSSVSGDDGSDFRFTRLAPQSHALYPVVDLFSSAHDLTRFALAILLRGDLDHGVRLLSSASVDEMLRVSLDAAPEDALGWQVRMFGNRRVLGHEGEDRGASTALYIDPATKTGVVVLANGDAFQSEDESRAKAINELISKLFAEARDARDARDAQDAQDAQQ